MFFVNRPLSIIPYVLGLLVLIAYLILVGHLAFFSFLAGIVSMSVWYYVFLIRYYILSGKDMYLLGVKLRKFKLIANVFLCINLFVNLLLLTFEILVPTGGFWAFVLGFYTLISYSTLDSICSNKFISEGIRNNSNIKNLKLDDIYQDLREVMLTKLIKSDFEDDDKDSEEENNKKKEFIYKEM